MLFAYFLARSGVSSVYPNCFPDVFDRPSALTMVVLDVMLKSRCFLVFRAHLSNVSCTSLCAVAGPINNCTVIAIVLMALQAVSTAASSYLFLKRVHAVYYGNNIVRHFFSFMWLVGVGTSCAVFSGTLRDYSEIADTKHCLRSQHRAELAIAYMVPVMFDNLVYFAILYRIVTSHRLGKKWSWKDFWCGNKGFPHFSQAILSGGQQYYG